VVLVSRCRRRRLNVARRSRDTLRFFITRPGCLMTTKTVQRD